MTEKINEKEAAEILNFLIKRDNLDVDDVLKIKDEMNKKEILEQHEKFSKIWHAGDGRWKTKVDDGSRYGKLVAKKSKEDIENFIVNYYKKDEKETKKTKLTIESLYSNFIDYKLSNSSMNNVSKITWCYNKYFNNTSLVKAKITEITTYDLITFLKDLRETKKICKRHYTAIKTFMNQFYDYCIFDNILQLNLARQIPTLQFEEDVVEKKVNEVIFVENTKKETIEKALSQFKKTKNTAYLAVVLNFQLGLRVGELVALRLSDIDFDNNIVRVRHSEIKDSIFDEQNIKVKRNGYKVVEHLKTENGKRDLVLTSEAKKIIQMILDTNEEYNRKDEDYLFITRYNQRMHEYNVNNIIRNLVGVRNEKDRFIVSGKPSGNHAVRKTCGSELHDSNLLSDRAISDFLGHKHISTTQKYYIHSVKSVTERSDVFEKVFNTKIV